MKIISKTKAPKNSCIPHGSWGLAQCNFERWTFIPCSAAKRGTNSPFKQEIVCLLTYSVLRNHSTNSIYSPPRTVKHWITRPRTARTYRRCLIMAYYLHPNMDKTKKVMQIWEIFKQIARHYESAAEPSSLLSSTASLATMGEICFKLNDCQELEFFKRYVWGTCLSKQVFEAQVTNEKVKDFEFEFTFSRRISH